MNFDLCSRCFEIYIRPDIVPALTYIDIFYKLKTLNVCCFELNDFNHCTHVHVEFNQPYKAIVLIDLFPYAVVKKSTTPALVINEE